MLPRSSLADATPPVKELDNDRNLLLRSGHQESKNSRNSHRSARRREPPRWLPERLGWPPISIILRNKKVSTPSDTNRIERLALIQYISPSEERDVPLVRPHITCDVSPKLREAFCLFSGTLVKLERGVNSHGMCCKISGPHKTPAGSVNTYFSVAAMLPPLPVPEERS